MSKSNLNIVYNFILSDVKASFMLDEEIDVKFLNSLGELDIPFYRCSISSFRLDDDASIFHDDSVSLPDILKELLEITNGDIEKAQKSVVILENFEQLSNDERFFSHKRFCLQMLLTNYINGINIPVKYQGKEVSFDTSNLKFIMTGNFNDLDLNEGYDSVLLNRVCLFVEQKDNKKKGK